MAGNFLNAARCSATKTLTAAQVKALNSTPIELVPAPGSGIVALVERISFGSTFVSAAYTGANALEFRYTDASGAKVTADIAAGTLNFSSGTRYASVSGIEAEIQPVANAPIVVRVPTANPGAGDSPVTLRVDYIRATLP